MKVLYKSRDVLRGGSYHQNVVHIHKNKGGVCGGGMDKKGWVELGGDKIKIMKLLTETMKPSPRDFLETIECFL